MRTDRDTATELFSFRVFCESNFEAFKNNFLSSMLWQSCALLLDTVSQGVVWKDAVFICCASMYNIHLEFAL